MAIFIFVVWWITMGIIGARYMLTNHYEFFREAYDDGLKSIGLTASGDYEEFLWKCGCAAIYVVCGALGLVSLWTAIFRL